jgi:hypothetical protein
MALTNALACYMKREVTIKMTFPIPNYESAIKISAEIYGEQSVSYFQNFLSFIYI